jgi:2-C-methyl-D-erythritol 4-phosphate cytidylyltransferase
MVAWPVDALRACEAVGEIVIAVPPGHEEVLGGDGLTVVTGGATRAQSVENALREVTTDLVAIHDAARPLLTPDLVEGLVASLEADSDAAGVIAAAPITDTVKRADAGLEIEETLDRTGLWGAQTPQVFWTKALRGALAVDDASRGAATDEAMLVEHAGGKVLIHPSGPENLKVTTPHDLRVAEQLLAERLGSGRA